MPGSAQTFQQIAASQPHPFDEYLRPVQPRPIDRMPPAGQSATGYEDTPVALGDIALGFLQGVRQNRIANFLEQDKNAESGLNNYRNYVNSKLQDPDLTDEGRQAVEAEANSTLHRHTQYELRDAPKHGVAGFFKNMLTDATGGQMKSREPINWEEATGRVSNMARGHSQKENYQKTLTSAMQKIQELTTNPDGSKRLVMPSEVSAAMAPFANEVALNAPAHLGVFQSTIGAMVPQDPFKEEMDRKLAMAIRGQGTTEAPPTQPPPQVAPDGSHHGVTVRIGPGVGAPVQMPQMVRRADSGAGVAAAAPTPAPATAAPPMMDLRDPVNRMLMAKMGYGKVEPTTIYDPTDLSKYAGNAVLHPATGQWVNYATGQPLPAEMQRYVPSDQLKTPAVAQDVVLAGSPMQGGAPQLFIGNRHTRAVEPFNYQGKPLYGSVAMEDTMGAGGRVLAPKIAGTVPAPPQESPGTAAREARETAALALRSQANSAAPGDKRKQLAFIAGEAKAGRVPEATAGRAAELVGDPAKVDMTEQLLNVFMGGGTTGTPPATAPTAAPPKPLVRVEAPPAAPAQQGARGLIRRQ